MVKIKPLTRKRLKEAMVLAMSVFPDEEEEPPSSELYASLYPKKCGDFLSKTQKLSIKYWVALNESGKVVGIIGLHYYEEDKDDTCWLGWLCVDKNEREKGIGTRLLGFSIKEAIKRGEKCLRIYAFPDAEAAQRLYKKYGFKLAKEDWSDVGGLKLLYLVYELRLK